MDISTRRWLKGQLVKNIGAAEGTLAAVEEKIADLLERRDAILDDLGMARDALAALSGPQKATAERLSDDVDPAGREPQIGEPA